MALNCAKDFWENNASDMMVFIKGGVVFYDTLLT
jgi:hypothetical protein